VARQTGFSADERRFLASLIRQVWRACQGFVAVVVERGPAEAVYVLDNLVDWSGAQTARLRAASGRSKVIGPEARHVAAEMLRDVRAFCSGIGDHLGDVHETLDPDEIEDEALMMVEGFLSWTTLMAGQLGISRDLKPQTLWHER
jgi:predicted trehalose synthase